MDRFGRSKDLNTSPEGAWWLLGTIVFSRMAPEASWKAIWKRQGAEKQCAKEKGRDLELPSVSQHVAKRSQDLPKSTNMEAKRNPRRNQEHVDI